MDLKRSSTRILVLVPFLKILWKIKLKTNRMTTIKVGKRNKFKIRIKKVEDLHLILKKKLLKTFLIFQINKMNQLISPIIKIKHNPKK
jgi:hypothetical protein